MNTTIYLQGGLGNQLFQFSAALLLARNKKIDQLRISPELLSQSHEMFKREFSIQPLLEEHEITKSSFPKALFVKPFHFLKILDFEDSRGNSVDIYLQPWTRHIVGYFQNSVMTDSIWESLRTRLFKTPPFSLLLEPPSETYVAVHVRLGDYLQVSSAEQTHGTCSMQYYINGIAKATEVSKCQYVKVVSDDIDATRTMFSESTVLADYSFDFIDGNTEVEDLAVLSQARSVVMSNSTFSWWGAYIAHKERNALIIYPSPWFNTDKIQPQELFCDDWFSIER